MEEEIKAGLELQKLVEKVRSKLLPLCGPFSKDDARRCFPTSLLNASISFGSVPIALMSSYIYAGSVENRELMSRMLGIVPFTEENLSKHLWQFSDETRCAFLILCQFRLEFSIKKIICGLFPGTMEWKYQDLVAKIPLDVLPETSDRDILNFAAYLRNCLHSNGLHTHNNTQVYIDGTLFLLEKDKKVSCCGWVHLFILYGNIVDIYAKILSSPKVIQLPYMTWV